MIISEVNSLFDLVWKATNFTSQLQDGWYKGSAELDAFKDKVGMLSQKHDQWTDQLRRHGISEDKLLLRAVQMAGREIEKQEEYVRRLQKNWLLRLRRKAFPGQLTYSLSKVLEIVDAGPQLLAERVATHDLLERSLAQNPASLPFSPDHNYVPISDSILEVRKALEDVEGPRVVTVYGGPGLGKSSLVKYLALQYEEEKKQQIMSTTSSKSPRFPDGVFYLFCGQGAQDRVKQLQLELLECLGFGNSSAAPGIESAAGVQGEYLQLPSLQMKLRSHVVEQRLLIILDDLWEAEVLHEFLVPAKGVKYLLTSQSRDVWSRAEKIQLKKPTETQAREIMANHTEGLPGKRKFPNSIRSVADEIIRNLDCHPLSLANVGISINSSRAIDVSQWEAVRDNLHVILDERDSHNSPVAYDRPYNLAVGASMMVMVESLKPEASGLLFLVALLEGPELPETLLKFFYKFVLSVPTTDFILRYNIHEKYLEDRSLVEFKMHHDQSILAAHDLRTHYIRQKKTLDVRNIASQILGGTSRGTAQQIQRGDAEETLVTILSAMYYQEPFRDVVATILESHLRIINDGVIPRSLSGEIDVFDLVKKARGQRRNMKALIQLLNPDGKQGWRQQAHEHTKKVIIKYICQDRLDDESMASLLQLPHTTSAACATLSNIHMFARYDTNHPNKTFTRENGETMKALLDLLQDDAATTSRRTAAIYALQDVLPFESKDIIQSVAEKWVELLAMDSNPKLQNSAIRLFSSNFTMSRASIIVGESPEVMEELFNLFLRDEREVTPEVRVSALQAVQGLSRCKTIARSLASSPNVLDLFFTMFLSEDWKGTIFQYCAGAILCHLSCVPEMWTQFQAVKGWLGGLGRFLSDTDKWEGGWAAQSAGHRVLANNDEQYIRIDLGREQEEAVWLWSSEIKRAATILSNLAQVQELREIIAQLPGDLIFGLRQLQLNEIAQGFPSQPFSLNHVAAHALTAVYSEERQGETVSWLKNLSPKGLALIGSLQRRGLPPPIYSEAVYGVYRSLIEAQVKLGKYSQALTNLDMANHHLQQIDYHEDEVRYHSCRLEAQVLRDWRTFLQAMLGDYEGALVTANSTPEKYYSTWGETGVIKMLSGDFEGALEDFNKALQLLGSQDLSIQFDFLRHRACVKFVMKDRAGARIDREAAERLINDRFVWEVTDDLFQSESPSRFLRRLISLRTKARLTVHLRTKVRLAVLLRTRARLVVSLKTKASHKP